MIYEFRKIYRRVNLLNVNLVNLTFESLIQLRNLKSEEN